ncbi:MAG: MGMT family protein [Planctomycetota bacterium]
MTEFEQQILVQVIALESGEVVSYGTIAKRAGKPRAARAVGRFLSKGTYDIPWWRVVRSDGKLPPTFASLQKGKLSQEGVVFSKERIQESPAGDFSKSQKNRTS